MYAPETRANHNIYKAVFIDRDGVVNLDRGYVYKIEDFQFIEGIFDVCRLFQQNNYKIVIISNQSGIGRGYFTADQFNLLNTWMIDAFKKEGVFIERTYYCPHHPEKGIGKYKRECSFRKPNPGMILKAKKDLALDLKKSILIGDKETDIMAGNNAGIAHNYLINKKERPDSNIGNYEYFRNLMEFRECLPSVLVNI